MARKSAAATARIGAWRGITRRPSWLARILMAFEVRKTRIDLSRLSDEQLCDIDLTRQETDREIQRKMWDAPEYFFARR